MTIRLINKINPAPKINKNITQKKRRYQSV